MWRAPILFSIAVIANSTILAETPNDPYFDKQWGLNNNNSAFDIDAPQAWAIEKGSKEVAIVVLDTGIDYTHPDLLNNMWVNPQEIPGNGIDDDNNGYIDDVHGINALTGSGDPMDDNGHGTAMAGVIGAEGNNDIGISGVMQKVSLVACKFLDENGTGSMAAALKCMDYVADLAKRDIGVTIVATNNAWGGGPSSDEFRKAIERHQDLGILFVVAVGGSASNLDATPVYPASYGVGNMLVVASANEQGNLTPFSNYGPNSVHLAAPGNDILSTGLKGSYTPVSGSTATAFVSGISGLLKSNNPGLSMVEIKEKILAGVTPLATEQDASRVISGGSSNAYTSLSNP